MQSFLRNLIQRQAHFKSPAGASNTSINGLISSLKSDYLASDGVIAFKNRLFSSFHSDIASGNGANAKLRLCFPHRNMTTAGNPAESPSAVHSESGAELSSRIKFKRLDKTARNIMQILDKEAVQEVKTQREIPDIRPGHIVQLKVEVPENKRRVSIVKGIVIARRNAGINTTFRLRRLVAGVGVESLYPLYSPNIKEIQILEKKKVRRAKLYYLRDKMNALKK